MKVNTQLFDQKKLMLKKYIHIDILKEIIIFYIPLNLQFTVSVHPSSMALLDKAGFCALQDNIFPLSSAFGRNVRELDVRLSEKVSFPD